MPEPKATKSTPPGEAKPGSSTPLLELLSQYRRELTFIGVFVVLLGGGFTLISLKPVNDAVIEPFTAGIAKVSGATLNLLGQNVKMSGVQIRNESFGVSIRNGCNGVETMIIFLAAVFAFPAPWKARFLGLAIGIVAIQAVNLVRVVALFLTGAYFPKFFDSSHTVIWQTIVILFGVLLWIFWANRFATPPAAAAPAEPA
jgi:exosortase H (IPTLxxWG-CTERM-specific)